MRIEVDATPAAGDYLDGVEFLVGGQPIGYASPDPSAPSGSQQTFKLEWFTEELLDDQVTPRYPNGSYNVSTRADAGASSAGSTVVSVTVDHSPRSAVLSQPVNAAIVSGDVPIEAHVSVWDGASLPTVELLISGTASGTVLLLWQPERHVWVPDTSPGGGPLGDTAGRHPLYGDVANAGSGWAGESSLPKRHLHPRRAGAWLRRNTTGLGGPVGDSQ